MVCTNQPISLVSNAYFKKLLELLNKDYDIPSKDILKLDLVPEMVFKFLYYIIIFTKNKIVLQQNLVIKRLTLFLINFTLNKLLIK